MTAQAALPSADTSPVPVSSTPVRTGEKPHLHREGGVGGDGGVGGAGYVLPPEQAPRLIQSAPQKRSHLPRFSHPRMPTHPKYVYSSRRQRARHYVEGKWAPPNTSAWPPRNQDIHIVDWLPTAEPASSLPNLTHSTYRGGSCQVVPRP
jgi:hypothetical protein